MQSNHNFQKTRREANIRRYDEAIKMQKRKHKPSRFVPKQEEIILLGCMGVFLTKR